MLKRLLYLAYYFKETDRRKLQTFIRHALRERPHGAFKGLLLWKDIINASLVYNISILDYFYFRFYRINDPGERQQFAGTGFLYEYQLKMNPVGKRQVLENKLLFLERYRPFVNRQFASLEDIRRGRPVTGILNNPSGKFVVKGSKGQIGAEVAVLDAADFTIERLIRFMEKHRFDLLEEYVIQHPRLMELSSSGLNTLRIFTQLSGDTLTFLGARLRITINSAVDNMAAGNMAAPVDIATGIVSGPGVFSDITKEDMDIHPVTGMAITGFQLPFWEETIAMMRKVAFHGPENLSVGWDIAITADGPELIEGNHNWCKLLWQLPVKKGLKAELLKFM